MGFVCFDEAFLIRWDLCPSSMGGVGRPDMVEGQNQNRINAAAEVSGCDEGGGRISMKKAESHPPGPELVKREADLGVIT